MDVYWCNCTQALSYFIKAVAIKATWLVLLDKADKVPGCTSTLTCCLADSHLQADVVAKWSLDPPQTVGLVWVLVGVVWGHNSSVGVLQVEMASLVWRTGMRKLIKAVCRYVGGSLQCTSDCLRRLKVLTKQRQKDSPAYRSWFHQTHQHSRRRHRRWDRAGQTDRWHNGKTLQVTVDSVKTTSLAHLWHLLFCKNPPRHSVYVTLSAMLCVTVKDRLLWTTCVPLFPRLPNSL